MSENILIGTGRTFRHQPESAWKKELDAVLVTDSPRLEFMTREHHLVRDTVVTELPRVGAPLSAERIASTTGLAVDEVELIVRELEERLFFLVRNHAGEVSWAYPGTVEPTPHRVELSTGETIFAA